MRRQEKVSLPVVDPSRTVFGVSRTACSCPECVAYCRFLPGYLIPEDLERLLPKEVDPLDWAKKHLRASPGAVVGDRATGRLWRVPTLVPARAESGACIYLDGSERCQIHQDAPFGCAFFDHRRGNQELSLTGLRLVAAAHADEQSLYHRLWQALHEAGLVALAPEQGRAKLETFLKVARTPWWKRKKRR